MLLGSSKCIIIWENLIFLINMEKELKIGQNVRTVDFKKTKAYKTTSAVKWNWECPELLKDIVTKGNKPAHFIQFTLNVSAFERSMTDTIWEYDLNVYLLTKTGKICDNPNNTKCITMSFCETSNAEVMWEKVLGIIHSAAKSKESFDRFINTIFKEQPEVFRLSDVYTLIKESKTPKILNADDFMKYLDTFVDNPRGWSEATGEIEDIARYCTQTAKEVDGLDVSHAPVREFGKKGPFKTPAEWNRGYKGYIKDIFGKMSKRAQDMVVKNTHQMFND